MGFGLSLHKQLITKRSLDFVPRPNTLLGLMMLQVFYDYYFEKKKRSKSLADVQSIEKWVIFILSGLVGFKLR